MRSKTFNRRSTFLRIMAVLVAAILVLYAFSLYIYNTSVNSLREKMTQQAQSMEDKFIEDMELDVARVKDATVKSYLKPDWNVVSFHKGLIQDYPTLQNVLRAMERLEAIRNISPMVYDVYAHFPVWGRTISSLKGLGDFDSEAFNAVMMPLDSTGAQFVYYGGHIYLTSAYRFQTPDNFSIVIRLDMDEVGQALKKLNTMEGSRMFLLRNDTGEVVAAAGGLPAGGMPALLTGAQQVSGTATVTVDNTPCLCVYRKSSYLGFTLVNLLPADTLYKPLEIYYVLFVAFSAIVLLTMAAIIFYIYRIMGRPMKKLMNAFDSMEKGDFSVRLVPAANDDFAYLYKSFDHMAENTEHLISEIYEKGLLVERARLKHLQAQINPHFLYNSFYTLHRMIKIGDTNSADVFSAKLGRYFQYITRDAQDVVPLKTEVEHAFIYSDIMAVRFGGAVDIEAEELPKAWEALPVPRLILQPLLENAFEHGLKQRTGRGLVRIRFAERGDLLSVSVEDNGSGMDETELQVLNEQLMSAQGGAEITGLANINRRVKLTFGPECGVAVSQGSLGGTCVELVLRRTEEGIA